MSWTVKIKSTFEQVTKGGDFCTFTFWCVGYMLLAPHFHTPTDTGLSMWLVPHWPPLLPKCLIQTGVDQRVQLKFSNLHRWGGGQMTTGPADIGSSHCSQVTTMESVISGDEWVHGDEIWNTANSAKCVNHLGWGIQRAVWIENHGGH